MKHSLHIEIR